MMADGPYMFKNLAQPLGFPAAFATVPVFTRSARPSRAGPTHSAQEWTGRDEPVKPWVSGPRALQTTVAREFSNRFSSTAASPNGESEVGSSRI